MNYREELFKALTTGIEGTMRDKHIDALVEVCRAARKEGYNAGIKDGNISDGTFAEKVKEAYENGVVTAVWEHCGVKVETLTQSGKLSCNDAEGLHRTGRRFPEIANILKQMQEGEA